MTPDELRDARRDCHFPERTAVAEGSLAYRSEPFRQVDEVFLAFISDQHLVYYLKFFVHLIIH